MALNGRRAAKSTRIAIARQTAKGTPNTDFASGNSRRLWTEDWEFYPGPEFVRPTPGFMSKGKGPPATADRKAGTERTGFFVSQAAQNWIVFLFDSLIGEQVVNSWTVDPQPYSWYSMAIIEVRDTDGVSTQRCIRLQDVYFHRMEIEINHTGKVMARVEFAYELQNDELAIDSIGGTYTLPAAPMDPLAANKLPFPGRDCTIERDPAGDNEALNFNQAVIVIDNKVQGRNFMSNRSGGKSGWTVWKGGKLNVTLALNLGIDDHAWDILDNSIADTEQRYKVTLTNPSGNNIVMDFYDMTFVFGSYAKVQGELQPFDAVGQAHVDSSDNYVSVTG